MNEYRYNEKGQDNSIPRKRLVAPRAYEPNQARNGDQTEYRGGSEANPKLM